MRLTLVQPPNGVYDRFDLAPPLGLLTLAAVVRDDGHDVALVDMNLRGIREPRWLENFYTNALQAIAETSPDVVGFTSMAVESHVCLEMARQVKQADPRVITVLGGPHFSAIAHEVLSLYPWVDFVVTGEGESALRLLLQYLQGQAGVGDLVNVAHRGGHGIGLQRLLKPLPSLARVPFPAYDLVDLSLYFDANPRRLLNYEPGRGCAFRCSFCYSPGHWGQGEQIKQAERVVEEVRRLRDLGARNLFFVQDNLLNSKAHALTLCRALAQARLGVNWNCYATLPQLAPEVLDALAAAGCREVFVGVDAISAAARRSFAKHFYKGWASLEERLRACLDRGIVPTCAFMIDPPGADAADTDAALTTALFARNLGCGIRLNTLTLYNHTASAEERSTGAKVYTELKPRLLLDTPPVIQENPFAREHPELFPFHHTYLPLPLYQRFVTGMHLAYTLFTSFRGTLLRYVAEDQASLWGLLDALAGQLGDLTAVPARRRRAVERDLFQQEFPHRPLSLQTRRAFELEQAGLRLSQAAAEDTVVLSVEGELQTYRVRPFEVVTPPEPFERQAPAAPAPAEEAGPQVLVRQERGIDLFAVDAAMEGTLRQVSSARHSGQAAAVAPALLGELIAAGVMWPGDALDRSQKGGTDPDSPVIV
jgi:radical SAM superfamily enzyme YgiQ (UPF0313 family)